MKYGFMYGHRRHYRISKMAEVLEAPRTGYYAWLKQGCQSRRQQRDQDDLELIRVAFEETRETYGPRRLSKYLRQQGHPIGRVKMSISVDTKDSRRAETHYKTVKRPRSEYHKSVGA